MQNNMPSAASIFRAPELGIQLSLLADSAELGPTVIGILYQGQEPRQTSDLDVVVRGMEVVSILARTEDGAAFVDLLRSGDV